MFSFLHLISLFLCFCQLFFIPFPVLYANEFNGYNSSLSKTFSRPRQEAERLIASFNLFPIKDINIAEDKLDSVAFDGPITEKKFRFPDIGTSTNRHAEGDHYAGFYQVPETEGSRLFYYYFESKSPMDKPVVLWLTGGPGCSSSIAAFYENGPYRINNDLSLIPNDYGWNTLSNIIFIDQPIGTGYSTIADKMFLRHNEDDVANDLNGFLQAFFKKHPELADNELFIAGESYGGHYVPGLASLLLEKNQDGSNQIKIPLEGIAIGNGLTDPIIQYQAYAEFALRTGLIDQSEFASITELIPTCKSTAEACDTVADEKECLMAFNKCNNIFQAIMDINRNINYYDIRKKCLGPQCYNFGLMDKYLNTPEVKVALGVHTDFVSCSKDVYKAMETDWMNNLEHKIPDLLKNNINVLIYAGVDDLICNWLGNFWWVRAVDWEHKDLFQKKTFKPFKVGQETKGELIREGPLIFFKMFQAGHMVPMDQPKASWHMFGRWMKGTLGIE